MNFALQGVTATLLSCFGSQVARALNLYNYDRNLSNSDKQARNLDNSRGLKNIAVWFSSGVTYGLIGSFNNVPMKTWLSGLLMGRLLSGTINKFTNTVYPKRKSVFEATYDQDRPTLSSIEISRSFGYVTQLVVTAGTMLIMNHLKVTYLSPLLGLPPINTVLVLGSMCSGLSFLTSLFVMSIGSKVGSYGNYSMISEAIEFLFCTTTSFGIGTVCGFLSVATTIGLSLGNYLLKNYM